VSLLLKALRIRRARSSSSRRTFYYDGPFTRQPDGTPLPPEDSATNTVHEFMGVDLVEAKTCFKGAFETVSEVKYPEAYVETSMSGYLLDGRSNESYAAVNLLLKAGVQVSRLIEPVNVGEVLFCSGSFLVPAQQGIGEKLRSISVERDVSFIAAPDASFKSKPVKKLRIGLYQRYWGGNMDEGWTRWLLEQYGFDYTTIRDVDVKKGGLFEQFDVIVLPSDDKTMLLGEGIEELFEKRFMGMAPPPRYPPEYRSSMGKDGVQKLKEFVMSGGTLVALGESSNFAIDELKLPIVNVLANLAPKDFFCVGSTLRVELQKTHPLAYGMPDETLIYFRGNLAFEIKQGEKSEDVSVVMSYPDAPTPILQSGLLVGDKYLRRKAALAEVKLGKGSVVLFGFSPQFRAQTDTTFKLFFNTLIA